MKTLFSLIVFAGSFLLFSCEKSSQKQAHDLIEKAVEAHGGAENWSAVSTLKFRKSTRLFQEDGSVESELEQWHEFRFRPFFEGKITWSTDSIEHVSSWDGSRMSYFMGKNEVKNGDFLASKRKDFDATFYAVSQPWKLLEDNPDMTYEGQKTLENGKLAESIRVDRGVGADTWWYYLDPESFETIAAEVHLKDHRSLVYNLGFEEESGLKFPGKSENWTVNEKGEKLFLRAEYVYSDFQITK